MEKFIYDESKQNWKDYLNDVKKILNSINSFTNDTEMEDKKNYKLEEFNNNNNNEGNIFSDEEQSRLFEDNNNHEDEDMFL